MPSKCVSCSDKTGYIIYRVQCKMKIEGLFLKNCYEFQGSDRRSLNPTGGPSEYGTLRDCLGHCLCSRNQSVPRTYRRKHQDTEEPEERMKCSTPCVALIR